MTSCRPLLLLPLCLFIFGLTADEGDPPEEPVEATLPIRIENTGFLRALKAYCESKNVRVDTHGTGQFRIMTGGNVTLDGVDNLLAQGEKALQGLETWTGQQGTFLPATVEDTTANYLVVVDDRTFDGFIKDCREKGFIPQPEGDDLTMKLRSFGGIRFAMLVESKFEAHPIMPDHWVVRMSSNMGLHAFFASWKAQAQPWITEGLGSELERLLCVNKTPLITTIAYEDNNPDTRGTNNWSKDVAKLLRDRTELMTAENIIGLDLISLSGNNYKQMWSVCQFIRSYCSAAAVKGGRNRFYQLLLAMAQGKTGYEAVQEVLGKKEPALSRAWAAWALKQQ